MSKTVEERIKVLEARQKRWQEAIYQGAAFELKLYQGRIDKMESALKAAVEAMELSKFFLKDYLTTVESHAGVSRIVGDLCDALTLAKSCGVTGGDAE